jgi:hypothetical protein
MMPLIEIINACQGYKDMLAGGLKEKVISKWT